ncbi:MAG: DUF937 domain-containing protein, partial [Saprospiraceae bacterium]|nr:DUF937 domain-containing protein [Saprospiraceae bacterium]
MSNLIETIRGYITAELLTQAAQQHDEQENGISKAIGGLVPAILAGLLQKSSDSGAMSSIFNLLSKADASVLDHPAGLLVAGNVSQNEPRDLSGQLLGLLFGAKVPAMTNAIASFASVKPATASSLLGLVGPLMMGVLNKKINSGGLNLSGLASLLKSERNSIMGLLPIGLGAVLGMSDLDTSVPPPATAPPAATGNRWLWPLLLLLGLGAAIIYYMKNCRAEPTVVQTTLPAPPPPPAPVVAKPTMYMDTLPGGFS